MVLSASTDEQLSNDPGGDRYIRLIDQAVEMDCPLWDVRAVAGHSLGMLSTFTGYRRLFGAVGAATKASKADGGPMIDALMAKQAADYADLSSDDLIARIDEI